jgi:amino acid adenylation domain-containing protein
MSELTGQPANSTAKKQELLALLLKKKGINLPPMRAIPQRMKNGPCPLSFAQQRLWFMDQLEPGNPVYNMPAAVRLLGCLDESALRRALSEIIRRHETLCTTFKTENGSPIQVIGQPDTAHLPLVDLHDLKEREREAAMRSTVSKEAWRPFDLAHGPLLRMILLRMDLQDHVFLFVIHHIVSDTWSTNVLIGELAKLYGAFATGQPSPLPELPIQYADFALWQRQWLTGELLESHLDYWKQRIGTAPPVLDLMTDFPRPAVPTHGGRQEEFFISRDVSEGLGKLAQQEQATLFMVYLAAFKTLLYRYTGQQTLLVGTPIANRNRGETERLIGFFANTLVLRSDLTGDLTFRELLRQVREVCLGAYEHQDLPFERLVEEIRPERDLGHIPLVQVMFVIQNAPQDKTLPKLPNLRLAPVESESGTASFDLALQINEGIEGQSGILEYNLDLFNQATIRRMIGHFTNLLEAISSEPEQRLMALRILSSEERHQLLVEWNHTDSDYPDDARIHDLFEARAAQSPNAVAVVFEDKQITYAELNRRANQLAHYLQRLGVAPETTVGIMLERSIEMLVCLLAVLKAGGTYLPLDLEYPAERLSYMLEDSHASLIVTRERYVETLPEHRARLVRLDSDAAAIALERAENLSSETGPDNLAYIIYTSGSTGKSKGVLVPHRGLCNLALVQARCFGVHPGSRVLQFFSFNFDASVWDVLMALMSGATLCLATQEARLSTSELVRLLQEQAITTATLPPSLLATLPAGQFPDLQTIVVTGEACSPELLKCWATGRHFFNGYGPTETTIGAAFLKCEDPSQKLSIGRPYANTQVYILDRQLQPVPVGVPGEIHVGGVGLVRGYLNNPDLTAEKFIPHPFSSEKGARIYRTGDLGRYLPDGNIEFLGRIDHQVKIRGYRIELGEIEAVLKQHEGVLDSAVIAREETTRSTRLVGYVAVSQEDGPGIADLRSFLQKKLPGYMIPAAFVIMESLPYTESGKVDRRRLALLGPASLQSAGEFVAPRTQSEELVAKVWSEILGVERVSVNDNFFELGGHSLLIVRVVSRIREIFRVELDIRALFEAPNLAALGETIDMLRRENDSVDIADLGTVALKTPQPERA